MAADLVGVFGQQVRFTAKRIKNGRDPYLAIISQGFNGEQALATYRKRWGIETLFGYFNKEGYQFEDTHMTKAGRISKLMAVLTVAFALCYRWGVRLEEIREATVMKHGYPAKSLFRRGFESLHVMFDKPRRYAPKIREFFEVVLRNPLSENFVV